MEKIGKVREILGLVLIVAVGLHLFGGCAGAEGDGIGGGSGKGKDKDKGKDIEVTMDVPVTADDLQKLEGDMFVLESTICEPIPDDMDPTTEYRVTYDGYVYCDSEYSTGPAKLSDEDYMELYWFCVHAVKTDEFSKYYEDVCDGDTYKFTYYDTDGEEFVVYDGYCYDNADLQDIIALVTGYVYE